MGRYTALYTGIPLLLFVVAGCASSKRESLKGARAVAEDFLRAVKDDDGKAAYRLLTPDYRGRLSEKERKEGTFKFTHNGAWRITGEEMATNEIEARFTGEVRVSREREAPEGRSDRWTTLYLFTLTMTREKDAQLWRVDLLSVAKEGKDSPGERK